LDKFGKVLKSNHIVLVGLMGAGKTTLGRRLATLLKYDFHDSDQVIEAETRHTISDLFAKYGEAHFRDLERKCIARLLEFQAPSVIATGGGAFIQPETRAVIKQSATSVWLHAELEDLLERVALSDRRPLLKNGDPEQILKELMDKRYPVYAEADIVVGTSSGNRRTILQEITQQLRAKGFLE
jgi:shikimate kinase